MDPQNQNLGPRPGHAQSQSLSTAGVRDAHLRENFQYTSPSTAPSLDTSVKTSVSIRCANPNDLNSIVDIQSKSPADFQIRLKEAQIERLVSNHQVLLAEISREGEKIEAGAIFFTSATKVTSYQQALDPSYYDPQGTHLYDFWIIVHKERATSADGTSVSTALISASDALAELLGKDGVIAFSRAGGARPRFYRTLDQLTSQSGEGSIGTYLDARPHFKAQLLLNYVIGCEPKGGAGRHEVSAAEERGGDSRDIRALSPEEIKQVRLEAILRWQKSARKGRDVPNPTAHHFVSWLRAEHSGLFDDRILNLMEMPQPESDWNPLANKAFAPLVGALLRKFCDRGTHLLIDPALGGLHTRLGARFHDIKLHSRTGDEAALESNILMSYERCNIDELITRLSAEYRKTN